MPENSSCSSAGSCTKSSCEGCPSHNGGPQSFLVEQNKFSNIKHVIGVVSGKGGVGKSFVTSSLAVNMAKKGYKVGILDADITGPSIPKMFGAHDQILGDENGLMHPYETKEGIKLISVNLLMDNEEDPVIWRGPVIAGVVKQFWNETAWGDIDYLFVDMPPGTGDVPLTVFQSLPVDGIVIVTSPQELVNMIVKKAYNMAEAMHITVLGVVENFSYLKCPDCGKTMHRVPEVIDCWFDSGAMPFAQHHYPFENEDLFKQQFPAQFISEAVDQTRGWFYSLMAESTLLFNKAPYENVIVLGHVQDENGQKMSKSKGNAVDPFDALETYGADAIRWYFYINSAPWLPNRFHGKAVQEGQRKFLSTLWNTYAFFVLYANIDGFDATKYKLEYDKLSVMDKWLLSKLNTVIGAVDDNLGSYKIPEAARALDEFVDDMSNWYVRRSRERFWAKGMEQDKINAYMTLYTALVEICKCAAPMIPFMTEEIYQNLVCSIDKNAPESIHLCDFPTVNEAYIDKELEKNMDEVLKIVVMGRACRNAANIKNRQPIGNMFVKAPFELSEYFKEIIEDELNVKKVSFTDDVSSYTSYTFKPQLRTVGPKYGKYLGQIQKALAELDGNAAMAELKENGFITLKSVSDDVKLAEEDLLITMTQMEGYVTEGDNTVTVVLDTNLTPELIEEGFVREIISKIQTMRKEAGFEVMDKIMISYQADDKVAAIFDKYGDAIKADVLGLDVVAGSVDGYEKEWNINGETVLLGVKKGE